MRRRVSFWGQWAVGGLEAGKMRRWCWGGPREVGGPLRVGSGGRFWLGSQSCCLMVFPPPPASKPGGGKSTPALVLVSPAAGRALKASVWSPALARGRKAAHQVSRRAVSLCPRCVRMMLCLVVSVGSRLGFFSFRLDLIRKQPGPLAGQVLPTLVGGP